MTPRPVDMKDREHYERTCDHDLLVEIRVKVNYLEEKIGEHLKYHEEEGRFNVTTAIAALAIIVSAIALFLNYITR